MENFYDLALAGNGADVLFSKKSAIHGIGLFTYKNLPSETIICRQLGQKSILSYRDKRGIIGIDGVDAGSPADAIFKKINHSCCPNAYLNNTGCLFSNKIIEEDTEITVDYSTMLNGSPWEAVCLCGEDTCRKQIKAVEEL